MKDTCKQTSQHRRAPRVELICTGRDQPKLRIRIFQQPEQVQSTIIPHQLYIHRVGDALLDFMWDTMQSCLHLVLVTGPICVPCAWTYIMNENSTSWLFQANAQDMYSTFLCQSHKSYVPKSNILSKHALLMKHGPSFFHQASPSVLHCMTE